MPSKSQRQARRKTVLGTLSPRRPGGPAPAAGQAQPGQSAAGRPTLWWIRDRTPHYLPELGLRPVSRGSGEVPRYVPGPVIRVTAHLQLLRSETK